MCFNKEKAIWEVKYMENNICEICKNEITPVDEVVCSKCGKTYHSWCWKSKPNCVSCGTFNKDYAKEKIDKATLNINTNIKDNNTLKDIAVTTDSGMFSNIGGKLKTLATVVTIIGIIAGIITFITTASMDEDLFFSGLLTGCSIALVSWIGSFALYGFGALISSAQNTERLMREVLKEIKK